MTKPKLKPCPFCEGTAIAVCTRWLVKPYSLVECKTCGASITRVSKAESVEVWNRRASGWIPVSERLPEDYMYCLVVDIAEDIKMVSYNPTTQMFIGVNVVYDVVAWMPLPEPYKEGECI